MAGLMDLLFPYEPRERVNNIKDESMVPKKPFSLRDAMKMDTRKYVNGPGYVYMPGENPRADVPETQYPDYLTDPRYTDMPVEQKLQSIDEKGPSLEELAAQRAALERTKDTGMMPHDWDTMSFADKAGLLLTGRGSQLWEARDKASAKEAARERVLQRRTKDDNALKDPRPVQPQQTMAPETVPQAVMPQQPMVSPQQQMIDQITQQRAMLDQLYPQRSYDNPRQDTADQYALDARDRADKLAQLAFFAGIANAAGGQWQGMGQGMMAAGAAYDQGFQRYQQALNDSATRQQTQSDTRYEDEVKRTNSAVDLYQESQKLQFARQKELQDRYKEERRIMMERFKTEEPKMADYPDPERDARWEDWRKRFGLSLERGEYISSMNDVTK